MILDFSPIRSDADLSLGVAGDVLIVNGEAYSFSDIPEGARLPAEAVSGTWLASDVTRKNGVLCLSVFLPHGPFASEERRFPQPVTVSYGALVLPSNGAEGGQVNE